MVLKLPSFVVVFVGAMICHSKGDTVHLMSVTSNPYGASHHTDSQFSCLLSPPDTGVLSNVQTGRHVPRGGGDTSLDLPAGSSTNIATNDVEITLPFGSFFPAQGMYYCEATSRGLTTRVPVTILTSTKFLEPANGRFTVTANVGESVSLNVAVVEQPPGSQTIKWEKQPTSSDGDFTLVQDGGTTLSFNSVTVGDAGVYATYWDGLRGIFVFSLIRLIVRECPAGRWGPPSCNSICANCYNGGMCDDKTGECVCKPGFMGPNCLTACSPHTFGWNCEHQCGVSVPSSNCAGSVFCMPDPLGCSCMAGLTDQRCQITCPANTYGANCEQSCHCPTGISCNTFTGECLSLSETCAAGYSGTNCQIPDVCPGGYYGSSCTSICPCKICMPTGMCESNSECLQGLYGLDCRMECHCLNGAACDRETGKCELDPTSQLSLCEPGWVSSTGVNFDNCQQYENCYSDCTKTCHCSGGTADCYTQQGTCVSGSCKENWTGVSCQTGIVDISFVKVNIHQPISVTCIATSDTSAPAANQVQLRYIDSSNQVQLVTQTSHVTAGLYSTTIFAAIRLSVDVTLVTCSVTTDNIVFATAGITIEYYALPQLSRFLRASSVQTNSVLIEWDAWDPNAGDTGEGPIIAYNVYDVHTLQLVATAAVSSQDQTIYSVGVGTLDPGTTYNYFVTAIREGAGGEGPPSVDFASFTTLAIATQPPIVDPTTKTTRSAILTGHMATMVTDTRQPIEQGTATESKTTVSTGNTAMGDIKTSSVSNSGLFGVSAIEISGGPEAGSVIIQWKIPDNDEISFYYIRYWKTNEGRNVVTQQIEGIDGISMHTISGLEINAKYHFQIQAETTTVKGPWSEIYVFTVPAASDATQPLGTNTVVVASIVAVVVIVLAVIVALLIAYRLKISNSNKMQSGTEEAQGGLPMTHRNRHMRSNEDEYEVPKTSDNPSGYYEDPEKLNFRKSKAHEYQSRINEQSDFHNVPKSGNNTGIIKFHTIITENHPRGYQNAAMLSDVGQTFGDADLDYDIPDPNGEGHNNERNYQELDRKDIDKGHEYQPLGKK